MSTQGDAVSKRLTGRQVALAVGVPLVLIAGLFVGIAASGGGDGNPQGSAVSACEDAVRDRLKAPKGAGFQSGATEVQPDIWRVVGSVDAQNGFGAKVRSDFVCTVTWFASSKTAEVQGVTIG